MPDILSLHLREAHPEMMPTCTDCIFVLVVYLGIKHKSPYTYRFTLFWNISVYLLVMTNLRSVGESD